MSEDNTKSGLIEVRLSENEISSVVISYIEQHLRPVTVSLFYDTLEETKDLKNALYCAVFNEMSNNILEAHIRDLQDTEET